MSMQLVSSIKTLRVRIKDRHAKVMLGLAGEVNQVWNFSQDLTLKCLEREHRFMSAFDIAAYTKGAGKEGMQLHSQTIQAVTEEYCTRRKQFKRAKLRWRVSRGARRSLGWIPFKASAIRYRNGQLHYGKIALGLWDSYGLKDYELGPGSFSEDARGRWYANITVKIPELCGPVQTKAKQALGIDLGLRELAGFSDAELEPIQAKSFYRDLEPNLAVAQRAGKKKRTRDIHAKIANRRKDFLHKLSTRLVKTYGVIVVGDVSSSKLVKTKMAKSVLDSGWSTFKTQLSYKSHRAATVFKEVKESFSTQDCSVCGTRTGPKGQKDLGIKRWTCPCCGIEHDRNRNAAVNIVLKGLLEIDKEISTTGEGKTCEAVVNKDAAPKAQRPGRVSGLCMQESRSL
jgi:putative transposase